jgi:hypothetical protein
MIYINALLIVISVFLNQNSDIKGVTVELIHNNTSPAYKLYMPENKADVTRALMLVNGLLDSDDKLLDVYSRELAKTGCAVVVPQIDGLSNLILGENEVNGVRASFQEVRRIFPNVPKGVFTFCFSNGPVFLALNEIANSVDFMYLFDSYADMKSMIEYNILGHYEIPGKNELIYIEAIKDIAEVYYQNFAEMLPLNRREVFNSALKGNNPSELNAEEKNAFMLLKNQKYMKFEELYAALPVKFTKRIAELTPLNYVGKFNCRITFIHCRHDAMVPYYESIKLFNKSRSKNKKLLLLDLPLHTTDSQYMNKAGIATKLKYLYEFYAMTVDLLTPPN